jgi:hypothetical protein
MSNISEKCAKGKIRKNDKYGRANFDLRKIGFGKGLIKREDSMVGFIQLQQNNGYDYDEPAEDLP